MMRRRGFAESQGPRSSSIQWSLAKPVKGTSGKSVTYLRSFLANRGRTLLPRSSHAPEGMREFWVATTRNSGKGGLLTKRSLGLLQHWPDDRWPAGARDRGTRFL